MRSHLLVLMCCSILVGVAGCSSPQSVTSGQAGQPGESPLAFPGAEGAGRLSLGGRGGRVVKVTNLNDSGPGSLRAAIELAQPRTILFDVSGTIALESPLEIEQPRVTIAGQSAPGDGIALRNYPLIVAGDDVVVRYIRSRLGDERRAESDAIWIRSGRRIILDHVSASWSVDETLSVNNGFKDPQTGFYDVTVQWSIIAESLNRSVHVKGAHGYGSLIAGGYGTRISFHHNLWAHHQGRNPRPGNPVPPARDPLGAFHDYRSNVFYDWGGAHSGYNADTGVKASIVKYNFVDNAYLPGPASTGRIAFNELNELAQAWFQGNTMEGQLPADQWALVAGKKGPEHRLAKPVEVAPVAADPAARAFERVLSTAGASLARDSVDRRVVQSVRDRSGGLIDSQTQVGGWPALASLPPLLDGDQDGMPDVWEQANGMNPYVADGSADDDKDGYTNLEAYLHELTTAPAPRGKFSQPTYNGTAFLSLQAAVNALPADGGEILLPAGEYREKIVIDKPNVRLRGLGASPSDVIVVWSDAAATAGGTIRSATLHVSGDNFRAGNLTIQNDYHKRSDQRSQAVALSVTADRAAFDNVRLLGAQDTLYAGSKKCGAEPCPTSRQYFSNCYIEGHVDFIFGDSKAFFENCQIHAIAHPEILITAHARTAPDQDKAFVFNNCTVTGEQGAERIYFGRPWRDHAAVIFMNTKVQGALDPQGWREWTPGKTDRLKLAYYAEFNTSGRSSDMSKRQSHTKILSAAEVQRWSLSSFLAGADGWNPAAL